MATYTQRDINYIFDYHSKTYPATLNKLHQAHPGVVSPFITNSSHDYIAHMEHIEQKFGDYFWLPLAVPRLDIGPPEELLEFWDSEAEPALRKTSDIAEPWEKEKHPLGNKSNWYVPQFKELTLYQLPELQGKSIWTTKLFTGKNKIVDTIVDYVYEYYPIDKKYPLYQIFMWESLQDVSVHKDHSAFWNCLTDFRTLLYDENTDPTLFVLDSKTKQQCYIDLPPDTNTFGWSNGRVLHGSDYRNKRKLLLIVNAVQCPEKTEKLLEKSVEKYQTQLNYSV